MEKTNDVGKKTQLVPTRLGKVVCGEYPGSSNSEVVCSECSGAERCDWGGCSGLDFESRRWSVDSLKVGDVFVALRGVYDGC